MASGQRPGGQQTKVCQFKLVLLGKILQGRKVGRVYLAEDTGCSLNIVVFLKI